jgi:beta-glucanase (GH16 family)
MHRHGIIGAVAFVALTASALSACGGGGGGGVSTGGGSHSSSSSSSSSSSNSSGVPAGYNLVWEDDFSTDGLPDSTVWTYDTSANATGWYNNEKQYYAANRLENSSVSGGILSITARKEDLTSAADYGGQHYTSARLITHGKKSWTYGYFEVRAKLPCGQGTWPAIWMLGETGSWPGAGEIDIMEQVNSDATIYGTMHTQQTVNTGVTGGTHISVPTACTDFHTYQLTWTAEKIEVGVDGTIYQTFTNAHTGHDQWPFDEPQYLLLNLAIGGDWPGAVDDSIFPRTMQVDYVKVYQKP